MALLTRAGAAFLLLLGQGAQGVAAAAPGDQPVGQVAGARPQVNGRRGGGSLYSLRELSPLFVGMEVATAARAGARLAINRDLQRQRGTVVLGSKTTVELTERLVNEAQDLTKMSWWVKLGQFRLALLPPPPGAPLQQGEYEIVAGDKPHRTTVRLRGTDVAVSVDRRGTVIVWVLEGTVTVETSESGSPVEVVAGYRLRVPSHGRPERPVHFELTSGSEPTFHSHPDETLFPDPPPLDLRLLRLDLPQ